MPCSWEEEMRVRGLPCKDREAGKRGKSCLFWTSCCNDVKEGRCVCRMLRLFPIYALLCLFIATRWCSSTPFCSCIKVSQGFWASYHTLPLTSRCHDSPANSSRWVCGRNKSYYWSVSQICLAMTQLLMCLFVCVCVSNMFLPFMPLCPFMV